MKKKYEQIEHRVPKESPRGGWGRRRQSSWNLWRQWELSEGRQAKMRTRACDCGGLVSKLDRIDDKRGRSTESHNSPSARRPNIGTGCVGWGHFQTENVLQQQQKQENGK
eukprot:208807-Pleurochrysis_carterae.AAC.1